MDNCKYIPESKTLVFVTCSEKSYSEEQHAPTKHLDTIAPLRISEELKELQPAAAHSDETSECYCLQWSFREV